MSFKRDKKKDKKNKFKLCKITVNFQITLYKQYLLWKWYFKNRVNHERSLKVAILLTLGTLKSSRSFGHERSLQVATLVTLGTVKSSRSSGHERSLKVIAFGRTSYRQNILTTVSCFVTIWLDSLRRVCLSSYDPGIMKTLSSLKFWLSSSSAAKK